MQNSTKAPSCSEVPLYTSKAHPCTMQCTVARIQLMRTTWPDWLSEDAKFTTRSCDERRVLLQGYLKTIVSCFLRTEPLLKYQTTGLTREESAGSRQNTKSRAGLDPFSWTLQSLYCPCVDTNSPHPNTEFFDNGYVTQWCSP